MHPTPRSLGRTAITGVDEVDDDLGPSGGRRRVLSASVRGRAVADRRAVRPRAARAWRPPQRRRRLPVLAPRRRGRRPRAARLVPVSPSRTSATTTTSARWCAPPAHSARRGAHRRAPSVEPPRGNGDRPLRRRAPPPRGDRPRGRRGEAACRSSQSTTHPAPRALETAVLPAQCLLLFGQEGPGLTEGAGGGRDGGVGRAVQLHPVDQHAGVAAGIAMHAWIGSTPICPRRGDRPSSRHPISLVLTGSPNCVRHGRSAVGHPERRPVPLTRWTGRPRGRLRSGPSPAGTCAASAA